MAPTITFIDPAQFADFSAGISGIVGAALLLVAGLAWRKVVPWFQQIISDLQVTKTQTTNDHSTNLRDDITAISEQVDTLVVWSERMTTKVDSMCEVQDAQHEDIRELRKDVRFVTQYTRDVDQRLTERERDHAAVVAFGKKLMQEEED